MIEAMKSFLSASANAFATPDLQRPEVQPDAGKDSRKNSRGYKDSAAVEIRLSPQARALMEAMERGEIDLDAKSRETAPEQDLVALEGGDGDGGVFAELQRFVDRVGDGLLSEEEAAEAQRLFEDLRLSLGRAGAEAADGGEGGEGLSPAEQLKAAVLFNELNRLLGGAGVFFGRDRAMARLTAEAQERARALQAPLNETVFGGAAPELSAPQQARMDVILRELDRLYLGAARRLPGDDVSELEGIFHKLGQVGAKPDAGLS